MNDSEYNELRAASWRRQLTPTEEVGIQAYLAVHPEAQADWEEDLALTRQLQELPDAPVSSNFTALVLQAVEAGTNERTAPAKLEFRWRAWLSRWVPRVALMVLTVVAGLAGLSRYQDYTRNRVAGDVGKFFRVANIPGHGPGPQLFGDFDAIQRLQPVSLSTDDDLLAALR